MTPEKARRTLVKHNAWRRYKGDLDSKKQPQALPPREIGIAIDIGARSIVALEVAMTVLRGIAQTPRNAKARVKASAAVKFIETQLKAATERKQ
jgi:hypothetical protein